MIDKSNLTLLYIIYAFNKTKEIEDILIKSFVLFNKTPMDYLSISIISDSPSCQTNLLILSCWLVLNNDNISVRDIMYF